MVRLKVPVGLAELLTDEFQFLHGSIKSLPGIMFFQVFIYFNSYMVRLKGNACFPPEPQQYHFNSYMVRLKGLLFLLLEMRFMNFNSYMVRLKVQEVLVRVMQSENFNSYMVRLKVGAFMAVNPRNLRNFNSYMVRLKVADEVKISDAALQISIPTWFD